MGRVAHGLVLPVNRWRDEEGGALTASTGVIIPVFALIGAVV